LSFSVAEGSEWVSAALMLLLVEEAAFEGGLGVREEEEVAAPLRRDIRPDMLV